MRAAVSLVASAASLVVAYGQLWHHPEDLALACAAFAATFLLVHHAALAVSGEPSSSSSGSDGEVGGDAEMACRSKRLALAMALVLYGLACAEVRDAATSQELAVAALASWCGAAVLLLVYLVTSARCHRSDDGIDNLP